MKFKFEIECVSEECAATQLETWALVIRNGLHASRKNKPQVENGVFEIKGKIPREQFKVITEYTE